MFKVRQDQMDEFDSAARKYFHARLAEFLRTELPEETAPMDDPKLLEYIAESERRAARYGVETERGIAQWTCLTFAAGMDFDTLPEVHAFLEDPDWISVTPDERVELLVDMMNAEDE
jgi:hypothetical protein